MQNCKKKHPEEFYFKYFQQKKLIQTKLRWIFCFDKFHLRQFYDNTSIFDFVISGVTVFFFPELSFFHGLGTTFDASCQK